MGAQDFSVVAKGKTAKEAFAAATADARYQDGAGGYTGTIAEKHDFVVIPVPAGQDPRAFAEFLLEHDDSRICDKWGPAGCVQVSGPDARGVRTWLFFGWASS